MVFGNRKIPAVQKIRSQRMDLSEYVVVQKILEFQQAQTLPRPEMRWGVSDVKRLKEVQNAVSWHLEEIAKFFKRPACTVIVRDADNNPDRDFVLTDETNLNNAVAVLYRSIERDQKGSEK